MIWILVLGGLVLVGVGLIGLKSPRPSKHTSPPPPNPSNPTTESEAWEILADPIISYESVSPGQLGRGNRGFRRGLATGLGTGLLIWGLFLTVTPQMPSGVPLENIPSPAGSPPPVPAAPVTPPALPESVSFTIDPGELPDTVASRLAESGLVGDSDAFLDRLAERGLDTRLRTGTFTIHTGSNLDEVIDALTT